MKRWALVTSLLYVLVLAALALPVICVAFSNEIKTAEDIVKTAKGLFIESFTDFSSDWSGALFVFWIPLGVLGVAQFLLLIVPVRLEAGKPVPRALLLLPAVLTVLCMVLLVFGLLLSLFAHIPLLLSDIFLKRELFGGLFMFYILIFFSFLTWAIAFRRVEWMREPDTAFDRMINDLLHASMLVLLIAVPDHFLVRGVHSAGHGTFMAIVIGISVMFFAFGPAVFVLFAARWRRIQPNRPSLVRLLIPQFRLDFLVVCMALLSSVMGASHNLFAASQPVLPYFFFAWALVCLYVAALWIDTRKALRFRQRLGAALGFVAVGILAHALIPYAAWTLLRERYQNQMQADTPAPPLDAAAGPSSIE